MTGRVLVLAAPDAIDTVIWCLMLWFSRAKVALRVGIGGGWPVPVI
jgi:hypothetical protein